MTQALGERRCGQQRVFALAQLGVVEVDGEGQHVNGEGVRKGGVESRTWPFRRHAPGFGRERARDRRLQLGKVLTTLAGAAPILPRILAGFAADLGEIWVSPKLA